MKKIQASAVFFDVGNTLLRVFPSIGNVYSEVAAQFGAHVSADEIEQSFKELWTRNAPLVNNEGHRLTYEKEKDWWRYLVREVFSPYIASFDFDAFFDRLFDRFAESDCWRLYDDVTEVLDRLKLENVRMAIISNWDSRLPSICHQLNITHYFETTVVSAIVGYEKPHPAIFEIALKETGIPREEVVYVGDDPFLDYEAAKKVGLHALHLDRSGRFPDHAGKITSLSEVFDRIEFSRS